MPDLSTYKINFWILKPYEVCHYSDFFFLEGAYGFWIQKKNINGLVNWEKLALLFKSDNYTIN